MNTMYIRLVIIAVFATLFFGTGWKVRGWKEDAAAKVALETALKEKAQVEADAMAKAQELETQLSEQRKKARNLNARLQKELQSDDAYSVMLPNNGVQLYNEAAAAYPTSKPDAKVRRTSAASTSGNLR